MWSRLENVPLYLNSIYMHEISCSERREGHKTHENRTDKNGREERKERVE
jgi:hypothetical protein